MPQKFNIEIFDVTVDGFPAEGEVAFFWGGCLFSGWPLIDRDNSYPGNRAFATPEQAKNGPTNVLWEASEDRVSGTFADVRYWFKIPEVKN